ncbi:MAG: xanthine dehydrogenase family protein subunit M [Halobacteriales archaeon]
MKPAPFAYHQPATVEEAVATLADHEDAELMAGNQSLGIVMANRLATPDHLIDLNGINELTYIDVTGDEIELGALVRHREIEQSEKLREAFPVLPEAAEQIAGPAVRNRGTLGGSLGEADPAGNYPTLAVTFDATLHLVSADGRRTVDAEEFFQGYLYTAIEPDELIERITIDRDPYPIDRTGMAFTELKPAAQTWPTVSAAAAVSVADPAAADPVIEAARLGLANVANVPIRVPDGEAAVTGDALTEAALDAVDSAVDAAADPDDELHADPEFKTEAAAEYARRAIRLAYERAAGD